MNTEDKRQAIVRRLVTMYGEAAEHYDPTFFEMTYKKEKARHSIKLVIVGELSEELVKQCLEA